MTTNNEEETFLDSPDAPSAPEEPEIDTMSPAAESTLSQPNLPYSLNEDSMMNAQGSMRRNGDARMLSEAFLDDGGPNLPRHSLMDMALMQDPTNFKSVQLQLEDAMESVEEVESNSVGPESIDYDTLENQLGQNMAQYALYELVTQFLYDGCWWLFKWPRLAISYLLGLLGCKRWFGLEDPEDEKKEYPTVYKAMSVKAAQAANANVVAGTGAIQVAATKQSSTMTTSYAAALAAGIAITAAALMSRNPTVGPPTDIYSRPLCNDSSLEDYDVRTGITRLVMQNVTSVEVNANKDELEQAFRDAYNNMTDPCDDEYERHLLGSELLEVENVTDGDIPLTLTVWESKVSCNGCPDDNPLFNEGDPPNDTDVNNRFDEFVTRFAPEVASTVDNSTKNAAGPTTISTPPETRSTPIVYIDAVDPNNPDVIVDSQGTMPQKMEVPSKSNVIPNTNLVPPENTADRDNELQADPADTNADGRPTNATVNNQAPSNTDTNTENNQAPSPSTSNKEMPSTSNNSNNPLPTVGNGNDQTPSSSFTGLSPTVVGPTLGQLPSIISSGSDPATSLPLPDTQGSPVAPSGIVNGGNRQPAAPTVIGATLGEPAATAVGTNSPSNNNIAMPSSINNSPAAPSRSIPRTPSVASPTAHSQTGPPVAATGPSGDPVGSFPVVSTAVDQSPLISAGQPSNPSNQVAPSGQSNPSPISSSSLNPSVISPNAPSMMLSTKTAEGLLKN
ncbi:unknown protein [Seminavis robusta]|uniref:Uncharacterized protein n=1 Tax=Seminavis robusta TaxID=568900 RepID=A0A9N8DYV1_9STRA|nr:unknown protein [Seminavis robusta]|eukprot:Sro386_g131950.1 n/a (732) ;mRNA; f:52002-54330